MKIRTLNDFMPPVSPPDKEEWEILKTEMRDEILFASSVELLKTDVSLDARVTSSFEKDGVVIENIVFRSFPGYYVTGNLYRPADTSKKYPAVLNPHGHWENGRFETVDLAQIPTRCFNFAKRGIVAFIWDMVGFNDSVQLSHEFFDPEFEKYNFGRFSVQLNNSIKAVDYLCSLPFVDKNRIGCTGCSGGGTQTYFLTAVDDRIIAAAPINMASSHMQGGCVCENTAFLRTRFSNTDYAMLACPRPLFMAACDGDWTWESRTVEFPAISKIYGMYGAEDNFKTYFRTAPHCYEKSTRELAYSFFCRAFGLDNPFDGEIPFEEDLSKLRINCLPADDPEFISGDEQMFEKAKKVIKENLSRLTEERRKDIARRVFALDRVFDLDIPYTEEKDYETGILNVTFGQCPPAADKCGVKYYHTYNFADDTKRINALYRLVSGKGNTVIKAEGKSAALVQTAIKLAELLEPDGECARAELTEAQYGGISVPGSALVF